MMPMMPSPPVGPMFAASQQLLSGQKYNLPPWTLYLILFLAAVELAVIVYVAVSAWRMKF